MKTLSALRQTLAHMHRRAYPAYKQLRGAYDFGASTVFIDHVQGDPFASPTTLRVRVSREVSNVPLSLLRSSVRRHAVGDWLTRVVHAAIQRIARGRRGIGKSGVIRIDVGGQEVVERTAMVVTNDWVEARLEVGLPAAGRTIRGDEAEAMLCEELPRIIHESLLWDTVDQSAAHAFVECIENYMAIREQLAGRGLVAFIADGSVLAREHGVSSTPMARAKAVTFTSPASLRVILDVPNPVPDDFGGLRTVTGCGIRSGLTVIVGGGFHGKSTVLQALQNGVYPHVPGDGREYVVTAPDAVKVRAEDGRHVQDVNIRGFIHTLPHQQSTACFSTGDASGSTSQAATIMEALEVGSRVLLMDEDTSATNFLVRDARMQALVKAEDEPITPLIDRVRELVETFGVSMVLVLGGCGDYFDVADTVLLMKAFAPVDATDEAQRIARASAGQRDRAVPFPFPPWTARIPQAHERPLGKLAVYGVDNLRLGDDTLDLHGLEQLVDESQVRAVGRAMAYLLRQGIDGETTLADALARLDVVVDREGLDCFNPYGSNGEHPGNFARPRSYEIAGSLNRYRALRFRQARG